jgi:glycosyltransferase involved in cell wall biosynthesis
VLAAHFALYAWPALRLLRGRRWVFHFHGPWSIESSAEGQSGIAARAKFLLERSVYRRASRFVVLSQAFATLLSERFDVPQEKIAVVPGGVDLDRFRPLATRQELRRKMGWESDKRIVLAVRRLAKRMGLENLIAAFAEVAGQFPDVVLYIAGKGAQREVLDRAVEERGLGARVKFLGFVADEDLPAAYAAADLTVVPSQDLEGFGLVTLESLACGTPCLVTPVGGLPEAVAGFREELVTKGSSASELASALASWLRESAASVAACRAYAEQFGWPKIAQRVMEVYAAAEQPRRAET